MPVVAASVQTIRRACRTLVFRSGSERPCSVLPAPGLRIDVTRHVQGVRNIGNQLGITLATGPGIFRERRALKTVDNIMMHTGMIGAFTSRSRRIETASILVLRGVRSGRSKPRIRCSANKLCFTSSGYCAAIAPQSFNIAIFGFLEFGSRLATMDAMYSFSSGVALPGTRASSSALRAASMHGWKL